MEPDELTPAEETLRTLAIEAAVRAIPSLEDIINRQNPNYPSSYWYDPGDRIAAARALATLIEIAQA